MLRSFTGYKGKMAAAQIGDIRFVLLAKNAKQLELLWNHIMANAGPLNPAGIKNAILIEAATLPDTRPPSSEKSDRSEPSDSSPSTAPIDV